MKTFTSKQLWHNRRKTILVEASWNLTQFVVGVGSWNQISNDSGSLTVFIGPFTVTFYHGEVVELILK